MEPLIRIAHQRAYPPFDTPTLTCHIAVRLPPGDDPLGEADVTALNTKRQHRIREINATVKHFAPECDRTANGYFRNPPPVERELNEESTEDGRDPADTLCVSAREYGAFSVGLIVEIHTEYTAFSFRAWPSTLDLEPPEPGSAPLRYLRDVMAGDLSPDGVADTAIKALYADFWDDFFVWSARRAFPGDEAIASTARNKLLNKLGKQFAEFQGLVIRTRFHPTELGETAEQRAAIAKADYLDQIGQSHAEKTSRRGPFDDAEIAKQSASGPLILLDHAETAPPGLSRNVRNFINDRPNFFSRLLGFRPRAYAREGVEDKIFYAGNSALCHVFDGLAAHGTTLGGDHPDVARYFTVYGGPSRHQLGRMMMALHRCGELRMAGLFDIHDLTRASNLIRSLDIKINNGADVLKNELTFRDCAQKLFDIAQIGRGGFAYRISRARYYGQSLNAALEDLRFTRIAGWQSYDGFVRRNIARQIDNITAIGDRFTALQRRMRQLEYVDTTRRLDKQTRSTLNLQQAADIFAIVLFTYYIGSILSTILVAYPTVHFATDWTCRRLGVCDDGEQPEHREEFAHVLGYALGLPAAFFVRFFVIELSLKVWKLVVSVLRHMQLRRD